MENKMKKKSRLKRWLIAFGVILLASILGLFVYVQFNTYYPSHQAVSKSKKAEERGDTLIFKGQPENPSVIFYQGAFVDNRSYSVWASEVAKAGYTVYLLKAPLNLAIVNPNQASSVIDREHLKSYVVGGHSLGGVMASRFAEKNKQQTALEGVFFLASYPDKKGSLKGYQGAVLSVVGTQDGVLNWSTYNKSKAYLPKQTSYQTIHGGNHAGFGSYGKQKGDNKANISNYQQQKEVATLLVQWLEDID